MKLTDKLDLLMKDKGISSRMGLSKESGVPYMTIVNFYEKGTENVKLSTLRKLADYFGVTLDYLVDDNLANNIGISKPGEMVNIPVVGRVSCGNGIIAFEEIERYEATPKEWLNGGEYFYLRAKGDSMTGARIFNGDLLLVRKQEEVENGEIAAVLIGEEAYMKRVYYNGDQIILQSESLTNKYDPIYCPPNDAKIIGRLKKIVVEV
ncbi:XRE family transcriptional regulator [Cohnella sp. AR92]|uniref:helix-turn-helix domain-containing protein n=1 Tax=Cohnella sp. AR92 TaxID=648716 RepID=UPI000F8D91C5|nr:XRE family transcriptional regulator [Cohnella sp. AR92]RUS42058.1 XRE family transcriptional regulator [Cohnella sp. AR92]